MPDDDRKTCLLKAAEIEATEELRLRHPLNPNSNIRLRPLSELAGLQRVRLTLGRIPPGKESFAYHAHEADEEFVYILAGRGRAEIGDETFEV
ncbi:MAG: cupin domain-containing protein, partial [Geminicoccaceae bacterium]